MAALPGYEQSNIPDQSDVDEVMENNPDIRAMVEKIAGHAMSYFLWMTVYLDTRQYDEWDPPLQMTITVPYINEEKWTQQYREFKTWLVEQDDYDRDRLSVLILAKKFPGTEA
jgi:hypothetical protein